MNEWLDLFGLESIWNDPDWPTIYIKHEKEKEEVIIDNESYYLYNKLKGK